MCIVFLLCLMGIISCSAAESVTSAVVPIRPPQNVFDPVFESSGGNDTARIADTTNVFTAIYVEDFSVDGDMTKAVWKKAVPVSPFLTFEGQRPFCKTEVKLLYSASALYVGATLEQPMDRARVQYDQDDQPVYSDDNLEILFLVPSGKGEDLLHLSVNPLGSCWDGKNDRSAWNLRGREIRTKRFGDKWMLEAKFPFKGLAMDRPVGGDCIGARFCRLVCDPSSRASAPQMVKRGNNGRHSLAKLYFAEPKGTAAKEALAYRARIVKERVAQRLAAARQRIVSQESMSVQFQDKIHPVYNAAVQAISQMKKGVADFETGKISTNDFIALDAGFRKYAGEHAYAVWTASPWECGDPKRLPPETCSGLPNLLFEQAGNEREAVCLEFTGLLCGPRIDLRLVPQSVTVGRGKKSKYVSCDAFEIYEEPFVNYEKDMITAPLVRKPGNMITLTPGRTTRVWVVFNSRGVEPGAYKTKILLKPAYDVEVAEHSVDVDLKIWNFTLPETRDWPLQTFFWGPNFFDNDEVQVLKLMHGYHVTHGWTKSELYTFGIHRDQKRVKVAGKNDTEFFDRHVAETANEEFFRTAKDLGMRFVFGWGTPNRTPEWFRVMDKRLRGMGFVPGDYIFKTLIKDEFVKHHIPVYESNRAAVTREFGTNLWFQAVYLSTPPPTGATMEDIEAAKLPEFFKMWTVIDSVFKDQKRGEDVVRRFRARGCKVWTYMCARYMQTKDILGYYRFYLWKSYMRELDGVAMWCAGTRGGDDGWDSRDGYDDGILWSGNGKEMIPTKRFEAWREGLEDVAYMDLLKRSGNVAAKQLLDVRDDVIKANDQKVLDVWRLAAGRLIDELSRQCEK